MNELEFFSATVDEADRKFEQACRQHSLQPHFYANPETGPSGETLNMGVCRIGPANAANRLLIISATHGIEGYSGAGIQTGWLRQCDGEALPEDTSIVMVHMLNPWGMAWNRRENEDNIDLFRNLIYCDRPSTPDPLYDLVHNLLDLEHWDTRDPVAFQQKADVLITEYGYDRLLSAIRRGQHHQPKGMTYHGTGPTWSKSTLDEIVKEQLRGARRIAVLDIHTGFGGYGEGIVMSYDPSDSARYARVSDWFAGSVYTPGTDANIPDHGVSLPYAWIETLVSGSSVTAEILEFGTFDPATIDEVFHANHYFHIYGDPLSPDGLEWGRRYRHFSYPEEDKWKRLVWHRGREVISKTLAGLCDWSNKRDQ